ncbi:MAG TPA: VOC family protein [Sporichthya sp.]|nr:VOC family protein [Sporichthya sp.]
MKAAINFITLAVEDLERSLAFYRDGLGWKTDGIVGTEFTGPTGPDYSIVMFDLANGLMLALWERKNLALDARVEPGSPGGAAGSFGIPADSQEDVDAMLAEAEAAGARITAPAVLHPFGVYSGYFADPDGNLWEVAWNPVRTG